MHHLQRRHLFRHEKHGLAFGQAVRNQVGDGLALAGAGRAFEYQIPAGIDRANGLQLRRVAQHRSQDVLRAISDVEPVEFACSAFPGKCFARVVDQVPDDPAELELLGAVLQVFPHQILGEGKNAEVRLLQHFPLGNFAHRQPKRLQHLNHINALVVSGHRIQAADLQLEAGFQQMKQCRVHDGFIVMPGQPETASDRLALQRDRYQKQRRKMHRIGFFRFSPTQQADGQVQRVGAALFESGSGRAIDGQQVAVQRFLRRPGQQFLVPQSLQRHLVQRIASGALGMDLRHAGVGALHQLRQWPYPELDTVCQRVFQPGQVRRDDLQRRLGRFEIKQPVAQRQVQQPRFPG